MEEKKSTDESDKIEEVEGLMEVLTRVDLDLAYSSEKLMNLNGLLMQISARETEHDESAGSAEFMEKALVFGLLSGVLDSEVRELDSFMVSLEAGILDAHRNISSCRHFAVLGDKLSDSRESLLQTRNQVSELKTQSAKLQRTSQALAHGKCEAEEGSESGEDLLGKSSGQRHILHMLEKSLARELDLEKKLSESRRREEELRGKLRYAEQSGFHDREDAEATMARLLEADCSSAVFEGVSGDLLSRLRRSRAELELKDMALGVGGSSRARAAELEALVESLRESVEIADMRAESAELKVAELIGTNVELTEELGFLKEGVGSAEKKFGGLEKQLREAEIQLQYAKASSEASQEQQNMLYAAIWDMETLIEDLKSKVAKAESKNEATEENCIALSETNAELAVEIGVLRDRVEELEASLEEAKGERAESEKEVGARTKLVMDMVARLANERERIQKQLNALTKENENFAKTLGFKAKNGSSGLENGVKAADDTEPRSSLSNSYCSLSYLDAVIESGGKSSQSNEPSEEDTRKLNRSGVVLRRCVNLKYVFVAALVALLSVLFMYCIHHKR